MGWTLQLIPQLGHLPHKAVDSYAMVTKENKSQTGNKKLIFGKY